MISTEMGVPCRFVAVPSAVSAYGNPFLHQGLPLDAESGQFHNRFRQYGPRLGRFAQRDPLGYVDAPSLYSYLGMNPLSWVDPSGLILVDSTGQIIFKPIGPPVPAKTIFSNASDSDTVQRGVVYTDKADPDKADPRNDKHVVPVLKLQKGGDEKLKCDCGGRAFLRGKYVIDDNRPNDKSERPDIIQRILDDDEWEQVPEAEVKPGDVVVYREKDNGQKRGLITHVGKVTKTDKGKVTEVESKKGTKQKEIERNKPEDDDMMGKREYWRQKAKPETKPPK